MSGPSCKNCGANIASNGDNLSLHRVNQFGVVGEWICKDCLDDLLEVYDGVPIYMHSPNCPNYCDYACNQNGEEIAQQIQKYLAPTPPTK